MYSSLISGLEGPKNQKKNIVLLLQSAPTYTLQVLNLAKCKYSIAILISFS